MLASLLGAVVWSTAAFPCAALVHEAGVLAESDAQEVILTRDADGAQVDYRVAYDGDAADFGWIVVIPAGFVSLVDGDDARFDALRDLTQPVVNRYSVGPWEDDGGCGGGCGALAKSGGPDLANAADTGMQGVDIVAEGFSGTYTFTVVAAEDADALAGWLDGNGWQAGDAQQSIDDYVAEGGYELVLVELRPDAAMTGEEGRYLPPVSIRTSSDRLFFPSRMARYAGPMEFRTVIYVEGDQAATVSGWGSEDMTYETVPDGEAPVDHYADRLWEIGGDTPTFARVYAGEVDGVWVTRFDARALAIAHTVDAEFALDGGTGAFWVELEVWSDGDTGAALLLLPLFGLGAWARRRRDRDAEPR